MFIVVVCNGSVDDSAAIVIVVVDHVGFVVCDIKIVLLISFEFFDGKITNLKIKENATVQIAIIIRKMRAIFNQRRCHHLRDRLFPLAYSL